MVGKDILRFHAVYWPAFLMGAGLPVQKRVFAHGWWTNEGQKISKSLGNVIAPHEIVAAYGLDQVRYFLLREVPFGQDGDFSRRAVIGRLNNDLANDLGNLAQRVLSMIQQYCGGKIPEVGALEEPDRALAGLARRLLDDLRPLMDAQAFHEALERIWVVVRAANAYVDHQAPWKLRKENPARLGTVLYTLAETIRAVGLVIAPFMPTAAGKILDQVAVPAEARSFAALASPLRPGTQLPKPQPVFPRYAEPAAAVGAAR